MLKKTIVLSWLLLLASPFFAQQVNYAEYFIDTDPGFGSATPVTFTAGADVTLDFNVDLSTVPNGFHVLYVRAQDDASNWSQLYSKQFTKFTNDITQPDVVKVEYFFDSDPGFGNAIDVPVTAGAEQDVSFVADISNLSNGIHVLYARAQDADGSWSQLFSKQFTKFTDIVEMPDIVKLEYFIDTDPGLGLGVDVPVVPGEEQNISFTADLTNLSNGIHVLYARAQDAQGNWSQIYSKQFTKFTDNVNMPDVVKLEYFIDTDPGYGAGIDVPLVPDAEQDVSFVVDLSTMDHGLHVLYARAQDENGNWSQLFSKTFTKFTEPDIQNIVYLEYFVDTDPGFGSATSVTIDPNTNQDASFVVDLGSVSQGVHTLYVRAKDANNLWSQVLSKTFVKTNSVDLTNITQLEYFIDTDPGFGLANQITITTPGTDVTQDFTIDLSAETVGSHNLCVRGKDAAGNWSILYLQAFEVQAEIIASANPASRGTITGDGLYDNGATVDLVATPSTGYNFVNWTEAGTEVSVDANYSFTASANRALVANFELQTFDIAASETPTGSGTITGTGVHEYGSTATLEATPATGYNFVNWTEAGTEVSTNATYSFTVDAARTLVANFELQTFDIAASATPLTGGSITGSGIHDYGSTASLVATPATGYNFVNWTEAGTEVSTDATYSFTVDADRTLVANFELQTFDIAASATPSTGGSITGSGIHDYGSTASLVATPATGYNFVNWTEAGTEVSTDATYSFTVDAARTLVANFELQTFDIAASATPTTGGSISGTGIHDYGSTASLVATPATGYNFVNWTETGTEVSTDATYSFTVDAARTLVANFELQTFDIAASATPTAGGAITGTGIHNYGSAASLVATPATGYNFVNWTEGGTEVSTDATYSFTVDAARTLVANFELQTFDFTSSVSSGSGGTVSGATTYDYGATATLTAVPDVGYQFVSWSENGTVVSTDATYSFVVDGSRNLVANFELQTFDIAATATPTEGGTVSGTGIHDYGATATLTATPETGYNFVNWTEAGTEVSTDATYSFTVDAARTLVANFELQTFDIAASATPTEGGTVSGTGIHDYGATATLTATPETGYNFINWTEGGTEVSTEATYSFTVDAARTLVANFELQTFVIEASISSGDNQGTITGTGTYNYGETATLSATPASGNDFESWLENDEVVSTDATYSFIVESDRTLVAKIVVATGIDDIENNNSYILYPNPTSSLINIKSKSNQFTNNQKLSIKLIDLQGKQSFLAPINIKADVLQVNVSDKKPGIYYIQISNESGEAESFKIVITK